MNVPDEDITIPESMELSARSWPCTHVPAMIDPIELCSGMLLCALLLPVNEGCSSVSQSEALHLDGGLPKHESRMSCPAFGGAEGDLAVSVKP